MTRWGSGRDRRALGGPGNLRGQVHLRVVGVLADRVERPGGALPHRQRRRADHDERQGGRDRVDARGSAAVRDSQSGDFEGGSGADLDSQPEDVMGSSGAIVDNGLLGRQTPGPVSAVRRVPSTEVIDGHNYGDAC